MFLFYFFDNVMQSETKQAPALEEYKIIMRTCECLHSYDIAGKRTVAGYRKIYVTKAGKLEKDIWRKKVKKAIEQAGKRELLWAIEKYCIQHCAWLKRRRDIEEYAMDVLTARAYRHWKDFVEGVRHDSD